MKEPFIPLSVPNLKGNELKYVTAAIETEWVSTGGPYVFEFENRLAQYVHCPGAASCQNGTAGIHTALLVLGVGREDAVIVPSLTFIAAVNPVKYVGAEPIFMDCDDSLCLDPVKLERYCREECVFENERLQEKKSGRHIKAMIVVHVFGNMADMELILKIAAQYHLKVIEDATEALGTYYTKGVYAGKFAGTLGDIGVYSFNGNKIITTGGGGMIVSSQREYLEQAKHLTTQAKSDELYYTHDMVGYNYRMTNLQAALGLAQLEQLETFIETKMRSYKEYRRILQNIEGLSLIPFRDTVRSNHWFYGVICSDSYPLDRDGLIRYFSEHNVQSRPIWGLINDQPPYQGACSYQIDRARYYWKHVVNIPCSSNLSMDDVHRIGALMDIEKR